jgi:8-hydroxy-5-deazaflavin:NADPH oxidoreductase
MRIAIMGGTGAFGRALAERLSELGEEIVIGSRDPSRAEEIAAVIGVEGAKNEEAAAGADLVILAVRSNAALDTARAIKPVLQATPLLCVASDLTFTDSGVLPGLESGSLAERVQEIVDGPVVAGLQSLAAVHLTQTDPPEEDALVCGDDKRAKGVVLELAERLVTGRAIDAGPLANARALEGMTAVILNVNRRYRAHVGIRLVGLP